MVFITGDGAIQKGFYYWDNDAIPSAWIFLGKQNLKGSSLIGTTLTIGIENGENDSIDLSSLLSLPSGAVMAFYLSNCPLGWISADGTNDTPDLRASFIRGLDNGKGVDIGRILGTNQDASRVSAPTYHSAMSHINGSSYVYFSQTTGGTAVSPHNLEKIGTYTLPNGNFREAFAHFDRGGDVPRAAYGQIRPRNIALLYCMKQ